MSYDIWNRRYTGSKYKLAEWIVSLINKNCVGNSFCDIFAGTGIIAYSMMHSVDSVCINDFLFSNDVIYRAFFEDASYDAAKLESIKEYYLKKDAENLSDNYCSKWYGGKFFSHNDAKIIGYIRDNIDSLRHEINEKERNILISSLLYSADKSANTVGHYDAYIKGKEIKNRFTFDLIKPYNTKGKRIIISRNDANEYAKKLKCDIVYIDPPYNSRQYSRFYHVLENITSWNKPNLYGEALKPKPENMSEYCRSNAPVAFKNLIDTLDCQYIVVSYNNTYKSKSSSSRNKITLEELKNILENKGTVMVFSKPHQYFNAGKTDFTDHKEYVFIVKVGD